MPSSSKQRMIIEHRRKTVAANLMSGLSYRDIAYAINCSIGTITSDVKAITKQWRTESVETKEKIVQIEARRLDRALNAIWTRVMSGDLPAIETMLRISTRRCKLLGLDQPSEINVSHLNDDDLLKLAFDLMGTKSHEIAASRPTLKISASGDLEARVGGETQWDSEQ